MNTDDREDTTIYKVVVNQEEQYSIWPDYRDNPLGRRDAGKRGTKGEGLAYIGEVWTDMRPPACGKGWRPTNGTRLMAPPEQPWRSPPPGLTLADDEVHVWRASLDQPADRLEEVWRSLSADERERADRFHLERDGWRFAVGRGALRSILGLYLALDPGQVQFCYGSRGKPDLARGLGDDHLTFNLAHAGSIALYALTRSRAIGIDVEQVWPLLDADQMAARFFSACENATYRVLPAEQKPLAFYLCWTRKEAYIKALGEGLAQPLESFDVSLAPREPARLLRVAWDPDEASRWSLISLTPLPGFVAALAVQGQDWRVACWDHEWLAVSGLRSQLPRPASAG